MIQFHLMLLLEFLYYLYRMTQLDRKYLSLVMLLSLLLLLLLPEHMDLWQVKCRLPCRFPVYLCLALSPL